MPGASKSRTAYVFVFGVTSLLVVLAGWFVWSDWVPNSIITQLPGATKADVRQWMGPPDEANPGSEYERWVYRRPFRLAEFRVDFTADGKVEAWSYDR
jgi:hypothetical protein